MHGAAGVLLIVRLVDRARLVEMLDCAAELGLFVLLEAFDADDLAVATGIAAQRGNDRGDVLMGLNCRDLETLAIDFERFERLRAELPAGWPAVAESGVIEPADAARVAALGYRYALVGTSLMQRADPESAVAELLAAGRAACDSGAQARRYLGMNAPLWIKICGMTDATGIAAAAAAGADALGFVFYAPSPRNLSIAQAVELQAVVPAGVKRVAVFLHPAAELVADVLAHVRPDLLQLDLDDIAALELPESVGVCRSCAAARYRPRCRIESFSKAPAAVTASAPTGPRRTRSVRATRWYSPAVSTRTLSGSRSRRPGRSAWT